MCQFPQIPPELTTRESLLDASGQVEPRWCRLGGAHETNSSDRPSTNVVTVCSMGVEGEFKGTVLGLVKGRSLLVLGFVAGYGCYVYSRSARLSSPVAGQWLGLIGVPASGFASHNVGDCLVMFNKV